MSEPSTSLHDRITNTIKVAIEAHVPPEVMAMQIAASLADAGPIDRAWSALCVAAADLGQALAAFDNAKAAYGQARRGRL